MCQWKSRIGKWWCEVVNFLQRYNNMSDNNNPCEGNFVGREDILLKVNEFLENKDKNLFALYGHPRIGKTVILKELERQLKENNWVVYFDFSERESDFSETVIQERLTEKIKEIGKSIPKEFKFEDILAYVTKESKRLIFLFDEFQDSVPVDREKEKGTFFQYLLQKQDSFPTYINFVLAVRKYNSERVRRFIRDFSQIHVSLFDNKETEKLVCLSETKGLKWKQDAIDNVYKKTYGHPFLTTALCSKVWSKFQGSTVESCNVDDVVETKIQEFGIELTLDGLNQAEEIVIYTVATMLSRTTESIQRKDLESKLLYKDELFKNSLTVEDIESAITTLKDAKYLEEIEDDGKAYYFKIKLLEQFLKKTIDRFRSKVKGELSDKSVAQSKYRIGKEQQVNLKKLDEAKKSFEEAIAEDPLYLAPNAELLKIQLEQGKLDDAYNTFYSFHINAEQDNVRSCSLLSRLSTSLGGANEKHFEFWKKVLGIVKDCPEAKKHYQAICEQFGNEACEQENWEQAKEYYQKAELSDKVAEIDKKIWEQLGDEACKQENWKQAKEYYQKAELSDRVADVDEKIWEQLGNEACKQENWKQAKEYYQKACLPNRVAEVERRIWEQRGDEAYQQKNWEKAKEYYQKAELPDSRGD
jgi:tetratricopeptide (TPR) repeat protein